MIIKLYVVLPETDEDFLRIGDDPREYLSIIQEIYIIKTILDSHDYQLRFDVNNFEQFAEKANVIVGGTYLSDIRNQLRILFKNRSLNTNDRNSVKNHGCTYVKWNTDITFSELKLILCEAAESYISGNNEEIAIANINTAFECERDTLNVIKDSTHLNGFPVLVRIPVLNSSIDLKEWIASSSSPLKFTLKNKERFEPTGKRWGKQMIYREKDTGYLWYYDYFHKDNKEHFEVFDNIGNNKGEADIHGIIKAGTANANKRINNII